MDVAQLSIQVNSQPAVKAVGDLDRLTASAARADVAADRLAANTNKVAPAMAGAGQNSRMFAMQLSQVAQQTSATGNFVQALAIQLPDMALGFGAVGIAAGVLASIALPMLANSFFDNANNATALSAALEDLTSATEDFRISAEAIRLGIDEQEVLIVEELNRKVAQLVAAEQRLAANRGSQAHVNTLRAETQELQAQLDAYRQNRAELEKVEYAAELAADATAGIGASADGALGAVQRLAGAMWDVAEAAMTRINAENQLAQMAVEFSPGGQAMRRFGGRGSNSNRPVTLGDGTELTAPRGGGGGGGGATDQYAAELEALTESLQSEREVLDAWYEESQAILADRRAQEILGTQAHKEALLALEADYQSQLAEIEGTSQNQRLTDTATFFGALASVASAGGQKTAKAVAAFQAIEGTINAYGAAIKALNTPGISLAGRFAAYASVLAAGLRGVAAIRSAGGVGGGGGGGGFAAQGAQAQPLQQQEFIVRGIDRDQLYTGDMLAKIFDGITDEAQKRGVQIVTRFA